MANKKKEDYAYTPSDAVSTWKLDISDRAHVIAAKAALSKGGFRGQRVQIPKDDLPAVIRKINRACKKFDLEPIPTDESKQSNELEHFGVKGLKWGVRRRIAKGTRKIAAIHRKDYTDRIKQARAFYKAVDTGKKRDMDKYMKMSLKRTKNIKKYNALIDKYGDLPLDPKFRFRSRALEESRSNS